MNEVHTSIDTKAKLQQLLYSHHVDTIFVCSAFGCEILTVV